ARAARSARAAYPARLPVLQHLRLHCHHGAADRAGGPRADRHLAGALPPGRCRLDSGPERALADPAAGPLPRAPHGPGAGGNGRHLAGGRAAANDAFPAPPGGSMTSRTAVAKAYTDAPELHPNPIVAALQLAAWLFFHPAAWANHVARIDPTLRPG